MPFPVVNKVKVTVPNVASLAEGVYVAFKVVEFGLNDPVPPIHEPPVAVVTDPFNTTAELLAHTFLSTPAFAVGDGVTVITKSSVTGLQVALDAVSLKVKEPEEISPAVGVYVIFKVLALGL